MWKRVQIALAILLVATTGVIAWRVLPGREPVYQGKRLGAWLADLAGYSLSGDVRRPKAREAVFTLGTNALAPLPSMLRARDDLPTKVLISLNRLGAKCSAFAFHLTMAADLRARAFAAYGLLGALANADVPVLSTMLAEETSPKLRARAALALHCIQPTGPAAAVAVRSLAMAARDKDSEVRCQSVFALVVINPDPEFLAPVLLERLTDSFAGTRELARRSLLGIGEKAVPALLEASRTNHVADQVLQEIQREHPHRWWLQHPSQPASARMFYQLPRKDKVSRDCRIALSSRQSKPPRIYGRAVLHSG